MSFMPLKWSDSHEIAVELDENRPDIDPRTVSFRDLKRWTLGLPEFADDPGGANDHILEAIQIEWIEEKR